MKVTTVDQDRFEPTVFGAARRHWLLVLVTALLSAAAGVGYTLAEQELYRADATVTVPQTSLFQGESGDQYLDSQVLLLQSQEVADRAARIANASLNGNVLTPGDFKGEGSSLEITPPEGATPGSYGSSIVAVSFSWPNARVAQVGANALLQAFDDARVAAITAQGEATVAGIEVAIRDARTRGQLMDLVNQRTQTLVSLQVDLARHPTVMWAAEPQVPINGNSKRTGAIALMVGGVLGAGLAYATASRSRCLRDPLDPVAIYDAPLVGEIPASPGRGIRPGWSAPLPLPMANDPGSPVAEAFRFTAGFVERTRAARGNQLVLAFVSADSGPGRSSVVANLALAVAESGTPVLAVDADSAERGLTGLLLPNCPQTGGFEQVLAGQCSVFESAVSSPLNEHLTVLGSAKTAAVRTNGVAYPQAVEELIGKAKSAFDLVLIDSPGLLTKANATDLVAKSDGAIIVISREEPVRDHLTMVERLDLAESEVVGYIYRQARQGSWLARRRGESSDVPSW